MPSPRRPSRPETREHPPSPLQTRARADVRQLSVLEAARNAEVTRGDLHTRYQLSLSRAAGDIVVGKYLWSSLSDK